MKEKLKIVQFMASERFGGAEKVFIDLSNELSKTHFITALVLRKTEYVERFSPRVEIVELKSHPTRNNPFLLHEIYCNINRINPDIVHTHGSKAAILLHRLKHFTRINHLATKHNGRKGRVFNTLPYVSAVSQDVMNSVKAKGGQQIRLIYNGINKYPVEKKPQHSVFNIAAIGRLDTIKGFDILIEQLATLNFPFQLIIAGEGAERGNLEKKIATLQMRENVRLIGFCYDIPSLMADSHLVVMASHSEGFAQVMVESLFYGNVFISTHVGGATEILPQLFLTEHNRLRSKITEVYHNYSDYRIQFEEVKKKNAGRFILSGIAAQYEAFYRSILSYVLQNRSKMME